MGADLSFDALMELARTDSLASLNRSTRRGSPPTTQTPSTPAAPAADNADMLADALPESSMARRAAVAALGHEVHSRMLRVNVIPSSAILAAALLPAGVVASESLEDMIVCPSHAVTNLMCALIVAVLAGCRLRRVESTCTVRLQ
jgi:hypothetical protein